MLSFYQTGKESMTKYGMVKTISSIFKLPMDHISPDPNPSQGTTRPHDAQLSNARIESSGIGKHTPFCEGIESALSTWVQRHKAGEL